MHHITLLLPTVQQNKSGNCFSERSGTTETRLDSEKGKTSQCGSKTIVQIETFQKQGKNNKNHV